MQLEEGPKAIYPCDLGLKETGGVIVRGVKREQERNRKVLCIWFDTMFRYPINRNKIGMKARVRLRMGNSNGNKVIQRTNDYL